jgi:hypothetical protein
MPKRIILALTLLMGVSGAVLATAGFTAHAIHTPLELVPVRLDEGPGAAPGLGFSTPPNSAMLHPKPEDQPWKFRHSAMSASARRT